MEFWAFDRDPDGVKSTGCGVGCAKLTRILEYCTVWYPASVLHTKYSWQLIRYTTTFPTQPWGCSHGRQAQVREKRHSSMSLVYFSVLEPQFTRYSQLDIGIYHIDVAMPSAPDPSEDDGLQTRFDPVRW